MWETLSCAMISNLSTMELGAVADVDHAMLHTLLLSDQEDSHLDHSLGGCGDEVTQRI
jgi:hypothetical protein